MTKPKHQAKHMLQAEPEDRYNITESYKVVRTNIMLTVLNQNCKKIVISSSLAGEGKTTTAVQTAVSLAQMDMKVVLLDADLRKPKINQSFNLTNTPGLADYLLNRVDLAGVVKATSIPNLSVICTGVKVSNPSELLAGTYMTKILKELETQFDYIIIDTPPLNVVVDALQLIKLSDGAILVVRAGSSTYPELNQTVKSLELVNGNILGFVLNGINAKENAGYRYRYKKHGKYAYGA